VAEDTPVDTYTEIKLANKLNYTRPPTDFNPTLSPTGVPTPYNTTRYSEAGLLTPFQLTEMKFNFMTYNSSLIVRNFYFY
jgi:hypothetical protein